MLPLTLPAGVSCGMLERLEKRDEDARCEGCLVMITNVTGASPSSHAHQLIFPAAASLCSFLVKCCCCSFSSTATTALATTALETTALATKQTCSWADAEVGEGGCSPVLMQFYTYNIMIQLPTAVVVVLVSCGWS